MEQAHLTWITNFIWGIADDVLRDLRARANQQQLKADFEAYLNRFSPNVQDILDNFEFRNQIPRLSKADRLGTLIEKFLDPAINLSPDPVHGLFEATIDGTRYVVEYEPDGDLRDTEQIPLMEEGGIETFLHREVLPHAPDAWFDKSSVKIGYEINFNRYFYKPQPLRTLEESRAEIPAVRKESEGLLDKIIGGS